MNLLGDFSVRIWDIDTSDNFLLPTFLPNTSKTSPIHTSKNRTSSLRIGTAATTTATTTPMEVFTCIAYCSDNQTLCAGTNQGNLYTWKRTNYSVDVPENTWQLNNISAVRGAIKQCTWGVCETVKPCIMVNCIANVYILKVRSDITKLGNYDTANRKQYRNLLIYIMNSCKFVF